MDQNTEQPPSPTGLKKKKWPKILGGIIVFILLAVGLAFYFTSGMVEVVEKQLAFLRHGNLTGAYDLTSKDFQKSTSLEQFQAFVKRYPSLAQNQGHTFTTRTTEGTTGTLKGTLTARDGAVTPVEFQLVKEQGEWRVLFIEMRATGLGTGTKGEEKSEEVGAPELANIITCAGVTGEDTRPVNITAHFKPESPEIHVVATVKNARSGTKARGVWIAVDAIETPNYEINSTELVLEQAGTATFHFQLSRPTNGWPPGHYKMDLYIDGKLAGSAPFAVGTAALPGSSSQLPDSKPNLAAGPFDLGPVQSDPKRLWTIAVYMGADNDLDPFALKDLQEMARGLPAEGVECIVLVDRARGPTTQGDDRTDQVVRIRRPAGQDSTSVVLARPGELNTANPAVLQHFLASVIKTFPARQYALIMWNHGNGWAHHLSDTNAPGSAQGHDHLSLPKLRQGIAGALKDTGLKKLNLVGFDMCLMAQLETATEISELAEVMVASEALEPGDGWPYEQILPSFGQENLGTRRLGAHIVEAYGKHYGERRERVATLSAIDLGEIPKLSEAMNTLAGKVDPTVPTFWPAISRAFFYSESYADRTDIRKGPGGLASVDLLDLLRRLRHTVTPFPAEKEYQDIVGVMDRAVIASYASPKHRLSRGLALYAPTTSRQYNGLYEQVQLAKLSAWPKLLATLHQTQKEHLSAPKITDIRVVEAQSGRPVQGGTPGGGFRLEATVEGENVLWVQYLQAQRDEKAKGTLVLEKAYVLDPEYYKKKAETAADVVDLIMPEFKGRRNTVSREFVGLHLTVTNGERAGRATIDGSNLADLDHVAVPVLLKRQGMEEHFATVFFNAITWQAANVVGEMPQPGNAVSYRQITPQPDDEVTLLFEFMPDKGEPGYLKGETLRWQKGLELLINADPPGEVIAAMRAESMAGASAFAKTSLKIAGFTPQEKQFIDNARKLTAKDLVGRWRWHGLKDGQWKPLPAYTDIAPDKANPQILAARIHNPEDPNWKTASQAVILDTRLRPTLRLISFADGRPVEAMNFTVLVSRWDQGSPRLVLKYLVPKGWLMMWAKEKPGAAPALETAPLPSPPPGMEQPSSSLPPPPSPAPEAAASLVGLWQNQDGEVLRIGVGTYEIYILNQLIDQGTYEIRNKQIFIRSAVTGEKERFSYRLQGETLILKDAEGETSVYQRRQ